MTVLIKKGNSGEQLPLTPLIDTVFNLLIFFLVASKFAEAERELDVKLPEASEAQAITERPREMFINIDYEGRYFVGGKYITLRQLDAALQKGWVQSSGRMPVVIRADKRCRWEFVVAAVNSCTKAKIRNYTVTTRDPRAGSG